MYLESEFTKDAYKTGEVAKILGLSTKTIMNYDKEGILKFQRTSTDRRIITRKDLLDYLNNQGLLTKDIGSKRDVIYARVSSQKQKMTGDLDRQALFIIENVKNLKNPLILKEVGSGLNDNRKQIQTLIKMIMSNEVNNIYVTYKDRLTRFGFNYLKTMCNAKGVEIIAVQDISKKKSIQEELAEGKADILDRVVKALDRKDVTIDEIRDIVDGKDIKDFME